MKRLRLFIDNDITQKINWTLINKEQQIENGNSTLHEISLFNDITIEIFLSANCCTIFEVSVAGLSSKLITEELILGMIEDSLIDDIELVKAVILRVEDEKVYVAVFDKEYYDSLIYEIQKLEKPVHLIQSFVYTTTFEANKWTLYLGKNQKFVRTSLYKYINLDNLTPVPLILSEMLAEHKPSDLIVYIEDSVPYNIDEISKLCGLNCIDGNNSFDYIVPIWNFYILKSTRFNFKLDKSSILSLKRLAKSVKYLLLIISIFWLSDVTTLYLNNIKVKHSIEKQLSAIVGEDEITGNDIIQKAVNKINNLKHQRGLYTEDDAVSLLIRFLDDALLVHENIIKEINYDHQQINIVLGSKFDNKAFKSLQNILETKRVEASIQDYTTYTKNLSAPDKLDSGNHVSLDDPQWVVTLKSKMWH